MAMQRASLGDGDAAAHVLRAGMIKTAELVFFQSGWFFQPRLDLWMDFIDWGINFVFNPKNSR